MVTASHTVEIAASRKRVFAFLMDLDNYPLWQAGISKLTSTNGMNVGSTINFHASGIGKSFKLSALVISNDGESCFSAISHRGPITFNSSYNLTSTKTGCKIKVAAEIKTNGVFSIAQPALQAISESRYEADLATLKIILESQNSIKNKNKQTDRVKVK
jgi:hypothetical protein